MPTICIRVTEAQKVELEERSVRFEGNVSEYIKDSLFGDRNREVLARLDVLGELVASVSALQTGGKFVQSEPSTTMLAEALILLRMSLSPEKLRSARAELDRLKIESWEPSSENRRG
ncbi:hypothetical protein AWB74_06250 [Caballeronia arvi]|uniref:Uncharacterized protein n=1 Tax=Caballeronia arvi TaxID=1777135 RepID=A0A158KNT8_9BURK|nr:hypothetical protein [Caballeronia arvi]SAL82383.1 hypothetical protein AWB74_06250 [Caballeronia arvi]